MRFLQSKDSESVAVGSEYGQERQQIRRADGSVVVQITRASWTQFKLARAIVHVRLLGIIAGRWVKATPNQTRRARTVVHRSIGIVLQVEGVGAPFNFRDRACGVWARCIC